MTKVAMQKSTKSSKERWFRVLVFVIFLLCVSLLAGYIAIALKYPSLYNVAASFSEYAVPLPFYWGMLHIPSMLIFGIPLLVLSKHQTKFIRYFRILCVCAFLVLLLVLGSKVPFLLFPKIDAVVALILSFVVFPPNRKDNPKLVVALKIFAIVSVLLLGFFAYSRWQHQTPLVTKSQYAGGLFELKSIIIKNDFHKEMLFEVDLKERVLEKQVCLLAQHMAKNIMQDYPFDNSYKKLIKVTLNPSSLEGGNPYEIGEISLNDAHKDKDGQFACYVKYKYS